MYITTNTHRLAQKHFIATQVISGEQTTQYTYCHLEEIHITIDIKC